MKVRIAAGIVLILVGTALLAPAAFWAWMITHYYVIGTNDLFYIRIAAWTLVGLALIAVGIVLLRRAYRLKKSN
ncbi:MAG TPA: hypothetical protein VHA35_06550 [Dongiaceae bacterium]|nr:hypothetical protein [Dongiaceae bacterium]